MYLFLLRREGDGAMLKISGLCAGYGRARVLEDISFLCPRGKITTVIGPNGSGKSTLLRSVVGLTSIHGGDITVDGASLSSLSPRERAGLVAYLPQTKTTPGLTVEDTVLAGRYCHLSFPTRYTDEDRAVALRAMETMGIVDFSEKYLTSLSGGERQKVYVAMAIAQESRVLMLDEPTSFLDIAAQHKLCDILRELRDGGMAILAVLHDILLAIKLSDRIVVIDGGRVAFEGEPCALVDSDVLMEVFGVEVGRITLDGNEEYYYRRRT